MSNPVYTRHSFALKFAGDGCLIQAVIAHQTMLVFTGYTCSYDGNIATGNEARSTFVYAFGSGFS